MQLKRSQVPAAALTPPCTQLHTASPCWSPLGSPGATPGQTWSQHANIYPVTLSCKIHRRAAVLHNANQIAHGKGTCIAGALLDACLKNGIKLLTKLSMPRQNWSNGPTLTSRQAFTAEGTGGRVRRTNDSSCPGHSSPAMTQPCGKCHSQNHSICAR